MKLSSLLNSSLIEVSSKIRNRNEAVEILTEKIIKEYGSKLTKDEIIDSINERETLGNTLLPEGIAIPHGRITHLEDVIVAIFLPKTPVIEDGREMKIMFLLLTSKSSSSLYLNTLAAIAKLTENDELFKKITNAESANEIISLINFSGITIKKELRVSDIMDSSITSVSPETTLREVVDLFSLKDLNYVPVIDKSGKFVGEVNLNDIIGVGLPDYISMIGNLSFLSTLEPFEDVLKNEDNILVKKIMKKSVLEVKLDTSIVELAFKLTKAKKRHAPVVEDGSLKGIVSLTDILNKILRAKLWI